MSVTSSDSVEYFYGFGGDFRADSVPTNDSYLKIQDSFLRTGLTTASLPACRVRFFKIGNYVVVL